MIGSLDRETWMLVAANVALGVAVLALLAVVAGGVITEALRRWGVLDSTEAEATAKAARGDAAREWPRPKRLRLLKGKMY